MIAILVIPLPHLSIRPRRSQQAVRGLRGVIRPGPFHRSRAGRIRVRRARRAVDTESITTGAPTPITPTTTSRLPKAADTTSVPEGARLVRRGRLCRWAPGSYLAGG
jgi:hypothetical protein